MISSASFDAYTQHVNPALGRFLQLTGRDLRLVRASGCSLFDQNQQAYDDWMAGFGACNFGHNPPDLLTVLRDFSHSQIPNMFVENLNPMAGQLAADLITSTKTSTYGTCFLSNSGSEAVEAALKTALRATQRSRVIYAENGYHGTTLGALACMGRGVYRDDFSAVLAPFEAIPFGDLNALEQALSQDDVAAFLVEPIQIEAGLRLPPAGYLQQAQDLCHQHGSVLILDEVQTGMGRTGTLYAWQQENLEPDCFVLAKSLGGGLVPIGATVMRKGLWEKAFGDLKRCEIHSSTMGGNALACSVAIKALALCQDPQFLAAVKQRCAFFFNSLGQQLESHPKVVDLRWRGLLGGLTIRPSDHPWVQWENLEIEEFQDQPISGALVVERLLRKNILAQVCGHDWSVLRFEPPLIVDQACCERMVAALVESLDWLEENG